jgi:hypothetical protein
MGVTVRRRCVSLSSALLLTAALVTACSGSGKPAASHPLSTLRAQAILTSERPVKGKEKIFHSPLTGESVIAVRTDGTRTRGSVDASGLAVLRLAPGNYVVTTSAIDACPPANVTLTSTEVLTVNLHCVAP